MESWRFTTTLTKLWRVMVPGHRSENHSPSSSGWLWQRWTNTQRAGMEDGRGVYQKHKTRQVRAHKQTNRANCGRGWGKAPQDSTIFLFCVVKLGRVPPTRPPFTKPLEEILLFLSPIFDSATLRQLHGTGELDLRCTEKTQIKDSITLITLQQWLIVCHESSALFPRKKLGEAEKLLH